ncbi:MAG TPA: hypothetical protein VMB18_09920 [Terriglobales bacterium]|nr:hypothetical protein [Terriglobales bacterium]
MTLALLVNIDRIGKAAEAVPPGHVSVGVSGARNRLWITGTRELEYSWEFMASMRSGVADNADAPPKTADPLKLPRFDPVRPASLTSPM